MPTYIVTGANRGLGLEFVRQLSRSADNTVVACIRSSTREHAALQQLAHSAAGRIQIAECDTSSPSSIHTFATSPSSPPTVDVLLNNAGINTVPSQDALTLQPSDLQSHMATNVEGPALLTQALLPTLSPGAIVLNVTSGLGSFGKAIFGDAKTAYAVSKAALNMLSAHQAASLGPKGVKVVVVDPGWVRTDMGGAGAALEAQESVAGVLAVIDKVRADEGALGRCGFYQWDGQEVPW